MCITNIVKRFFAKPRRLRRSAITAAIAAPIIRWSIRHRGHADTIRRLGTRPRHPARSLEDALAVAGAARAAMDRLPLSFSCLDISLVVWWLVGGDEVADIRLGVMADEGDGLKFHAWVEVGSVVINDSPNVSSRYDAFAPPLPPSASFE